MNFETAVLCCCVVNFIAYLKWYILNVNKTDALVCVLNWYVILPDFVCNYYLKKFYTEVDRTK